MEQDSPSLTRAAAAGSNPSPAALAKPNEAPPGENPEDIAPLLADAELLQFVAVWPRVPIETDGQPDLRSVALLLNTSGPKARQLYARASMLGFVKPGGAVHFWARQLVIARCLDALPGRSPARRAPARSPAVGG